MVAVPLYFLSVNYHSASLLSDLMHTLADQTVPSQGIVIVNNSPADRVVHRLAGQTYGGAEVSVIDAPGNGGFGAGCNLGLRWIYQRSPGALVWLINPDTQLLPGAVAAIRTYFAQRPQLAILGTPILDLQGKRWFSTGRFNRWTGAITSRRRPASANQLSPTRWVSGCSMILNLAALGHCPQFDQAYFLYYEDCDLCERYFLEGQPIAVTPEPWVIHAVSSITARSKVPKFAHATFSKLLFLQRYGTPLALWLNVVYFGLQVAIGCLTDRRRARGRWQGMVTYFQYSAAARKSRSYVQTQIQTPDLPPQALPEQSVSHRSAQKLPTVDLSDQSSADPAADSSAPRSSAEPPDRPNVSNF